MSDPSDVVMFVLAFALGLSLVFMSAALALYTFNVGCVT